MTASKDTAAQKIKTSDLRKLFESRKFLTCAGTETYLCFQQGFDLPEFCAFAVYDHPDELDRLEKDHLSKVLSAAAETGHGLLIDAMIWRAQPDFLVRLGRDPGHGELVRIHEAAVGRVRHFVDRWRSEHGYDDGSFPVLIVADIGPRGDGYKVEDPSATSDSFRAYHAKQIRAITEVGGIDLVIAYTITGVEESIGIVQACVDAGLPVVISPTVETDGRLPDGSELRTLIEKTDEATNSAPLFYGVNCSHPTHLLPTLEKASEANEEWLERFRGFRANASPRSHEELDNSTELDRGNVKELARSLSDMRETYSLHVVGGCCGTDHEHIAAIAETAASP
jgi:S-methylmethionine-dependent homocysteine/selenocysteine methylase